MPSTPAYSAATAFALVEYERRHHEQFRKLNLEWISEYFEVEPPDRLALDDPEHQILLPGGSILIAEQGGEVVGTCALLRGADGSFELAKMAVAKAARGQGIGRALGLAALARARARGARRVWLLSNTALEPAIALYEKLGFRVVPLTPSSYRRANVKMERDLLADVRCVVVVADELSKGLATNAAAVLAISLGSRLPLVTGPDVVDAAGDLHAGLTWLPLTVLKASRRALQQVRDVARSEPDVLTIDLPEVGQKARRYEDYVEALGVTSRSELQYVGIVLYGDRSVVTQLTSELKLL